MKRSLLAQALYQWAGKAAALPVHAFRLGFSSWMPPSCRYLPSCSDYALEAIQLHGPVRGSWLATRRVLRCHPWCAGGLDEVPAPKKSSPYSMN